MGRFISAAVIVNFILLHLTLYVTGQQNGNFTPQLRNRPISNLAYDHVTKSILIGAKNAVFRTDTQLTLMDTAMTGPVNDTLDGQTKRINHDNYNELLLVMDPGKKFLTCGTGHAGKCEVCNLTKTDFGTMLMRSYDHMVTSTFSFNQGFMTRVNDEQVVFMATPYSLNPKTADDRSGSEDDFYPISSRLVGNLNSRKSQYNIQLNSIPLRKEYPIIYRAIDSVGDFIYFLSNQNHTHAKIAKMCLQSSANSFEEITITCTNGSSSFPFIQHAKFVTLESGKKVLFGLFSDLEDHRNPDARGAVCIFSEDEILEGFQRARVERLTCPPVPYNKDKVVYKLASTGPGEGCKTDDNILNSIKDFKYCNKYNFGTFHNLVGFIPLNGKVVYTTKSQLTITTYRLVNNLPEIYVGTAQGDILKFFVGDETGMLKLRALKQYTKVTSTGVVDLKSFDGVVYTASGSIVVRLPEEKCSGYTSCDTCMRAGTANCGWCVITRKCTEATTAQCPYYSEGDKGLWLPSVKGMCTQIKFSTDKEEGVKLEELSQKKMFTFKLMPHISINKFTNKKCQIGQRSAVLTEASVTEVSCEFNGNELPKVLGLNALQVTLDGTVVATKALLFYDCTKYPDCQQDPRTDCYWCTTEAYCKTSKTDCTDVIAENVESCPHLLSSTVKLPENEKKNLTFSGKNLLNASGIKYECFNPQSRRVYMATVEGSTSLVCQDVGPFSTPDGGKVIVMNFTYTGTAKKTFLDSLMEHNSQLLRKSSHVEVYSCPRVLMKYSPYGNDCSSCNYLPRVGYQCRWCSGQCSHMCGSNQPCSSPQIRQISPTTGPVRGNTLLTLSGINLGVAERDINFIKVGDSNCTDIKFAGRNVTCRTGSTDESIEGAVEISVDSKTQEKPMIKFSYKKPVLTKLHPVRGIKRGGTKLTIEGRDLQIGNRHVVIEMVNSDDVSKRKTCQKLNVSDTSIVCRLKPNEDKTLTSHHLKITFDGRTSVSLSTTPFIYFMDPFVRETVPKNLVSIRSGGTKFKVKGERLTIATEMYVMVGNQRKNCQIDPDDPVKLDLLCEFPPYPSARRRKRSTNAEIISQPMTIVLHLDGWSQAIPDENQGVNYVSDPVLVNLTKPYTYDPANDSPLMLRGKHLMLVLKKKEFYRVEIGSGECLIAVLENEKIECQPPRQKPQPKPGDGDKLVIRVKVAKLSMVIGEAVYVEPFNSIPVIIALVVIFLVIIVVVTVLLVRRFQRKSKMEIEKIMMEMKEWEDQAKADGKEEFADMQLTITDIKKNIGTSGIPYHSYQVWILKVLFPGRGLTYLTDFLQRDAELNHEARAAMDSFEALLYNKTFTKILIRALEKQKRLSMQEKAHLSALLAFVLMHRMKDFYDIVEQLLSELIEDTTKKQYKVLFNRFDSITLRLLVNWLYVALYPYFKDDGASSLYVLYKAIETVVEKRPIDHVTGDAKNTLSQDSFLTEKVDFASLRLTVDFDGQTIQCEVLDCDTISQVKHKCMRQIYMHQNKPVSQMPSVDEVKLVWRTGSTGGPTLNDLDQTSKIEGQLHKMNTLRHYNVKDGSHIILSYKFSPDQDEDHKAGEKDVGATPSSPTDIKISETTNLLSEEAQEKVKKFHLVKDVDDEGNTLNRKASNLHLKEGLNMNAKGLHITSLMHTKLILQEYIRAVYDNILRADQLPPVVGYLFGTLDSLAENNSVETDIVQAWKSESFGIRIWANLISHPDLLFDIDSPRYVDSCLESIRQVLLDCLHGSKISKESSLQKLLFALEIPEYQRKVEDFYRTLSNASAIPTDQFSNEMTKISNMLSGLEFKTLPALQKIFKILQSYKEDVLEELDDEGEADLRHKLQMIAEKMEDEVTVL